MTGRHVFLSYRREHQAQASRLFDSLSPLLGSGSIWIDSRTGSADRWEPAINEALQAADVMLVLTAETGQAGNPASASQESDTRAVLEAGRPVILVRLEGDPGTATAGHVAVLRSRFWDEDVRRIAAMIRELTAATPATLLPAPPENFVDRVEALSALVTALPSAGFVPTVLVITGPPGSGKTALALVAAAQAATDFPDGRLYASAHGRADTSAVLAELLRDLGVPPSEIPESPSEQVRLYRSLLTGRRTLIVLDDVDPESDVQQLLPPDGTSAVLVTSRGGLARPLRDAEAATVQIGGLPVEHAMTLLRASGAADVVDADPAGAERLVNMLDGLPLALRLVAGQARRRGLTSFSPLIAEMDADSQWELPPWLLEQAYDGLPEPSRRLFRLLGTLPTPHLETGLAAALVEADVAEADTRLQPLVAAALIDTRSGR